MGLGSWPMFPDMPAPKTTWPQAPMAMADGFAHGRLSAESFSQAPSWMHKQLIGEKLHGRIRRSRPELAGKITGMLLELDDWELLLLLERPDALDAKVEEACR